MSDEDDDDIIDVGYRGRGRPRLPPDQKRREKMTISLTADELRRIIHTAADVADGPVRKEDWARAILMDAVKAAEEAKNGDDQ